MGERVAAAFLRRRGAVVVDRNLQVGRGELDLVVEMDGVLVAVEVKTIGPKAAATDPIDRIGPHKLLTVRRLASRVARDRRRPVRVDFVGVRIDGSGALVNWRTGIA
jgi:putative endonuclease